MEIKEIWKDIEGYENLYQVSNLGRVKSLNYRGTGNEQILKQSYNNYGYLHVGLRKNKKTKLYLVHILVAKAFIQNIDNKPYIDHINTIRDDNRVENLRWVTPKENSNNELTLKNKSESQMGDKNSMYGKTGSNNPNSKKIVQLSLEGNLIKIWGSIGEAERGINGYRANISYCCRGIYKTYKGFKWMYYEDYIKQGEMNNEDI